MLKLAIVAVAAVSCFSIWAGVFSESGALRARNADFMAVAVEDRRRGELGQDKLLRQSLQGLRCSQPP